MVLLIIAVLLLIAVAIGVILSRGVLNLTSSEFLGASSSGDFAVSLNDPPTSQPTGSKLASLLGTLEPSSKPPTLEPSYAPSSEPTPKPTTPNPTRRPTVEPSNIQTSEPSPSPTTPNPTRRPTLEPSRKPVLPVIVPSITVPIDPRGGSVFDHYEFHGLTPTDESNIDKIMQIVVYSLTGRVGTDSGRVISLRIKYLLKNGTTSEKAEGEYGLNSDKEPAGTIDLRSDEFLKRIELVIIDRRITNIMISTSTSDCFGPWGSNLDEAPTAFLEEPNSVIKAFYGFSGLWLDTLGVYYEASNMTSF